MNDSETSEFMRGINAFFESMVGVKRIRNGEHQTLETLINEETLIFTKYLRGEAKTWVPRVPGI
jgi:hypothetical protein